MSGNNYPKKMQVHLTEEQHQAFKDYAYRSKVSMMECVRVWIGEKCSVDLKVGKVVLSGHPTVPVEPLKKTPEALEVMREAIGRVAPIGEVLMERCSRCGDTVPAGNIMREPRTGRKLCPDCVENIKNGQV